ncbi:MAG: hypothetical protein LBB87_05270 [Nitrososphaerota archaeon]|nr:hypothetical protein [Nitrososphaerota archaeon]
MESDILTLILGIVLNIVIVSPILWIAGRMLVGNKKAKFTDALWIVALGTIASAVVNYVIHGLLGSILMLIIVLLLVRHFFDCGWIKALLISIVAAIIFIVVAAILGLIFGVSLAIFGVVLAIF